MRSWNHRNQVNTNIMAKFWLYFSSAYGTLVLGIVLVSIISQSHIDTGLFGLIGFPAVAIIYAMIRMNQKTELELKNERLNSEIVGLTNELFVLKKRMEEEQAQHEPS